MNVVAIVSGWAVDTVSSLLFGGIIGAIVGSDGASEDEVIARMTASPGLVASTFVLGLAFTGIGGYVAASLAQQRRIAHAAAVGALSLLTSLAFSLLGPTDLPYAFQIAGIALTIPVAALGGWLRASGERPA